MPESFFNLFENDGRILYHGSPYKFDEFSLNNFGRVDDGYLGYGIYFYDDIDEANYYGPWIYAARLKAHNVTFEYPNEDVVQARMALSKLDEFKHLSIPSELPKGYYLKKYPKDEMAYGVQRDNETYAVMPRPELYDDPNVMYGSHALTPLDAVATFWDELNDTSFDSMDSTGLLRSIDRKNLHKVMLKNGYTSLRSGMETVVYDLGVIQLERRIHQELDPDKGWYY